MGHQHPSRNILLHHYMKESGEKGNTGDSLHQAPSDSIDLFLRTKHGESKLQRAFRSR